MFVFIPLAFPTLRQARSSDCCYFSEKLLYKNSVSVFISSFFLFCSATRCKHLYVFRNLWLVFVWSPSDKHAKEWSLIKLCALFNAFLLGLGRAARVHSFIRLICSHGWSKHFLGLNLALSHWMFSFGISVENQLKNSNLCWLHSFQNCLWSDVCLKQKAVSALKVAYVFP